MKIRPNIEVPDGTECTGCVHLYENVFSGYNCALFVGKTGDSVFIEGFSKCPQCRAAEVKDDDAGMLEYDTDTGIYRVRGKGNSLDNLRVVLKEDE